MKEKLATISNISDANNNHLKPEFTNITNQKNFLKEQQKVLKYQKFISELEEGSAFDMKCADGGWEIAIIDFISISRMEMTISISESK